MRDRKDKTDAFRRFMDIVTGALAVPVAAPDPDEERIRALERQVRNLQRSVRQSAARRRSRRVNGNGTAGD